MSDTGFFPLLGFDTKAEFSADLWNRAQLRVQHLDEQAKTPARSNPTDAGLDLYNLEYGGVPHGSIRKFRTGIAVAIPDGYVGLICDRSSLGAKGLKVMGGVIDSGYRGEIIVALANATPHTQYLNPGDRIAQLLLIPVALPIAVRVDSLEETQRGSGGFGSTGA